VHLNVKEKNTNRHVVTLIALAPILVVIVLLLLSEAVTSIRSLFSISERFMLIGCALLVFLLPIVIRILNSSANIKANTQRHKKEKKVCPITGTEYCCIDSYISELQKNGLGSIELSQNAVLEKYNLTVESTMNGLEQSFGVNPVLNALREIWIFSYNLDTEVLGDISQNYATANINQGLRYIYFHTANEIEKRIVDENKEKILKRIDKDQINNVLFIPLEESSTIGIDIIAHIIGSILFVDATVADAVTVRSFFSLRGNGAPMYFRLPNCMNRNYYAYFEQRKKQYENAIGTKK